MNDTFSLFQLYGLGEAHDSRYCYTLGQIKPWLGRRLQFKAKLPFAYNTWNNNLDFFIKNTPVVIEKGVHLSNQTYLKKNLSSQVVYIRLFEMFLYISNYYNITNTLNQFLNIQNATYSEIILETPLIASIYFPTVASIASLGSFNKPWVELKAIIQSLLIEMTDMNISSDFPFPDNGIPFGSVAYEDAISNWLNLILPDGLFSLCDFLCSCDINNENLLLLKTILLSCEKIWFNSIDDQNKYYTSLNEILSETFAQLNLGKFQKDLTRMESLSESILVSAAKKISDLALNLEKENKTYLIDFQFWKSRIYL